MNNAPSKRHPSIQFITLGFVILMYGLLKMASVAPQSFHDLLISKLAISNEQLEKIFAIQPAFFIAFTLLAGLVVDLFDVRIILIICSLLTMLAFKLLIFAHSSTELTYSLMLITALRLISFFVACKLISVYLPKNLFGIGLAVLIIMSLLLDFFYNDYVTHFIASTQKIQPYIPTLVMCLVAITMVMLCVVLLRLEKPQIQKQSLTELLSALKNHRLWLAIAVSSLALVFSSVMNHWGMDFFQQYYDFSWKSAKHIMKLFNISDLCGLMVMGILSTQVKSLPKLLAFSLFAASLFAALAFFIISDNQDIPMLLYSIFGFFLGSTLISSIIVLQDTPTHHVGLVFAVFAEISFIAFLITLPLGQFLLSHFPDDTASEISVAGWQTLSAWVLILLLVSALLPLFMRKHRVEKTSPSTFESQLMACWQGKINLSVAFGVVNLLGLALAFSVVLTIQLILLNTQGMSLVLSALLLVFALFANICVWRCRNNLNKPRIFKYLTLLFSFLITALILVITIRLI